jgi:hypothetical protein
VQDTELQSLFKNFQHLVQRLCSCIREHKKSTSCVWSLGCGRSTLVNFSTTTLVDLLENYQEFPLLKLEKMAQEYTLAKVLALIQALLIAIQFINRQVSFLPSAPLEISALDFAVVSTILRFYIGAVPEVLGA